MSMNPQYSSEKRMSSRWRGATRRRETSVAATAAPEMSQPISSSALTQGTLVSRAQSGDQQAFSALIEPHLGLIYRSARKITANHEDAEDACQESMIKAFVHIQSFKGNSKFSTWLTRIAMNEALMIVRKVRVESRRRLTDGDVLETPRVLTLRDHRESSNPETQCARREQKTMLWDAVRRLEADSRAIVYSFGFAEADARQIAEMSHLSCSGVRSRRQRALRNLRAMLDRKFARTEKAIREWT